MTPVQGLPAAVQRAAGGPPRPGAGPRDANAASSFGDLYRTHVGERPGDRGAGSVGGGAGRGIDRGAGPRVGPGVGPGVGLVARATADRGADPAVRSRSGLTADRDARGGVPQAVRRDVPEDSPPPQVTALAPTSPTAARGVSAERTDAAIAATVPAGASTEGGKSSGVDTSSEAASSGSGPGGGSATSTPSGSPALSGADAAGGPVAAGASPSSGSDGGASGSPATPAPAGPDAGGGEPSAAAVSGAAPVTDTAASSGLRTTTDSAGTGAVPAPTGPTASTGPAAPAAPGAPADGSAPASAPTSQTATPAAEAGTADPVAAEAGGQDAVDPGTPTPTDDGTIEQAGAAPQPVPGRADLPAPPQPVSGGAVVGSAEATAAAPARPAAVPLPQQLGSHAFALAQSAADAPGGTSTITVTVAPDDLGPITIRASFAPDGTRLEFFSSTDGGREALKQAMPDLRREASSSGLSASLDLGTGTPEDRRDGRRDEPSVRATTAVHHPVQDTPWTPSPTAGSSTLDLFA